MPSISGPIAAAGETKTIALAQRKVGESGDLGGGVAVFVEGAFAVIHRPRAVEKRDQGELLFALGLPDHRSVVTSHRAPIKQAGIVAGNVGPVGAKEMTEPRTVSCVATSLCSPGRSPEHERATPKQVT